MSSTSEREGTPALAWAKDVALGLTMLPLAAAAGLGLTMAYKTYHPPRKAAKQSPDDFGLPARSMRIPVPESRIVLDAWFIPAEGASHTVIVGHGIGRNKSYALPYAAFLHQAGYNVVAFDHRNHGSSSQDRALRPMSRRFTDDMAAVIEAVRTQPETGGSGIALLSFSFSTFPALYVTQRSSDRVKAIICDSGPARNISPMYARFIDYGKLALPGVFRGPILFRIVETVYRRTADAMLAVSWPPVLAHLPVRLLFISNEDDWLIPPSEVEQVARLHPEAEYWEAPAAGHLMALRTHGDAYRELTLDFLRRAFEEVPAALVQMEGGA